MRNLLVLFNVLMHNALLFSLRRTGTPWAHSCCFLLLIIIYGYYEAQSDISLFQMNKLFSHHFWCSKLEIFDPLNSRSPIRFPDLPNEYVNDCRYDAVLFPKQTYLPTTNYILTKLLILTEGTERNVL